MIIYEGSRCINCKVVAKLEKGKTTYTIKHKSNCPDFVLKDR